MEKINTLIVGGGEAGKLLYDDIIKDKDSSFNVLGFIDDTKKSYSNINILGGINDIPSLVTTKKVRELIIAIPSGRGELIRKIVENSIGLGLSYKILPRISEVLRQEFKKSYLRYLRKLKPEDLLGGEIIKADQEEIAKFSKGQVILITGAAGSIGSELSRQISAYSPKKVIFYDWWENGMFELSNYIKENYPDVSTKFIIGDVKSVKKINAVMARYKPTTVFHAAAYKHVPLMEGNPVEAVKNNIFGTKNVAELSIKHGVKKFILVSTDKAVNPTNVMGATKRAAEKIIHILSEGQNTTTFCAVRFGNVINSNGSAIPIFEKQIEKGGPVTVTHKEITRYFMTISEAVHLILQAWVMGENNDLFVLDMGEPIKIYDLARMLIAIDGYVPDKDIKINIVGLRPGEKLYEEVLVNEESVNSTPIKKIFKTKNYMEFDKLAFLKSLPLLEDLTQDDCLNRDEFKRLLSLLVSTYTPQLEKELVGV